MTENFSVLLISERIIAIVIFFDKEIEKMFNVVFVNKFIESVRSEKFGETECFVLKFDVRIIFKNFS